MTCTVVMDIRVGFGYDVHKWSAERPLILGGITIAHEMGLYGHSDADILLHAITDALLGALALGDIGTHFPDTDSTYKGADSAFFLEKAYELVGHEGYKLGNIDYYSNGTPKVITFYTYYTRAHCFYSFCGIRQYRLSYNFRTNGFYWPR